MKCRILRHFIWVFTVCKSTPLGASNIQRVKITYLQLCLSLSFQNGSLKIIDRCKNIFKLAQVSFSSCIGKSLAGKLLMVGWLITSSSVAQSHINDVGSGQGQKNLV